MNKVDLSDFYADTETSETRAYEHALDEASGFKQKRFGKAYGREPSVAFEAVEFSAQYDAEDDRQVRACFGYQYRS